jgi:hypothetical protein
VIAKAANSTTDARRIQDRVIARDLVIGKTKIGRFPLPLRPLR